MQEKNKQIPRFARNDRCRGTRSEAIIPVMKSGIVVGTLDVESDRVNAFTQADTALLERCVTSMQQFWM